MLARLLLVARLRLFSGTPQDKESRREDHHYYPTSPYHLPFTGLAFSSRYASSIGPPYCPFPFCLPARTSEKKLAFLLLELFLGNDAVIPQRGIAAYLLYRISYGGRGIRP